MKKAISLLCVLALLISLSACGPLDKIAQLVRPSADPEPTATAAPEPTRTPKPSAEPTPAPTKSPAPSHDPKTTPTPAPTPEPVVDGRTLLERICGTYIINAQSDEETQLDIYTVGGKLMAEFSGVYSFWGEELFPYNDAELLDTQADSIDLIALPYDGNTFAGSYWGYSFLRTLTLRDGGIVLSRESEPDAFYERVEPYDDVGYLREYLQSEQRLEAPTGSWRGYYYDDDYDYHTVYLEINADGTMYFLDRDEISIPHIMHGVYSSENNGDGTYDLEYMMTERANYKMPYNGYFLLEPESGVMYLSEPEEERMMSLGGYAMALIPCAEGVTPDAARYVEDMTNEDTYYEDVDCDGVPEEIYYETDYEDGYITCITVYVDGYGESVNITAYDANVYFMYTGKAGQNYLYFECYLDNDYRDILVYSLDGDAGRFVGEYYGGFYYEPDDPYFFVLTTRVQMLSTSTGWKPFRVGAFGLPEALDTNYSVDDGHTLTIKRDMDAWTVDIQTGELIDYATIPAGTELTQLATDNKFYYDLLAGDDLYRIWVDTSGGWPQTVDGSDIDEIFDGVFFVG
jgi:hypothetical protein